MRRLALCGLVCLASLAGCRDAGIAEERARVVRGIYRFETKRGLAGAKGDVKLFDGFRSYVERDGEIVP